MSRRRAALPLVLAIALPVLLAPPAVAEIFRCRRADGSTVFTSDPSSCPSGSKLHEPKGSVQIVPGADGVPQGAAGGWAERRGSAAAAAAQAEDAQESMWRRKRVEAARELAGLEDGVEDFRRLVTWCNRGGALTVEDEVGLRRDYSCDEVRQAFEEAEARQAELRAYLAGGIEEECRRAGCLPGWIRPAGP